MKEIYIDPELSPAQFLEVAIHEATHLIDPDLSEFRVETLGVELGRWLRRLGYERKRRI